MYRSRFVEIFSDPMVGVDGVPPPVQVADLKQGQYRYTQGVARPSPSLLRRLKGLMESYWEEEATTVALVFGKSAKAVFVDSGGLMGLLPHEAGVPQHLAPYDDLRRMVGSLVQLARVGVGYRRVLLAAGGREGAPGLIGDLGQALLLDYLGSVCERRKQELKMVRSSLHLRRPGWVRVATDYEVLQAVGMLLEEFAT